ncbi:MULTISPECIES: hypothetical protein [Xanthomonas]|uniref:hypothetical protein n=1 Tax=Xanthomonas TaxID=338 RepID=UPI0011E8616C|nr:MULTISPECIES: hypothetical protein [Xanthomonas]MCW0435567.1 hypothetical protein [Xanthomonas sacchari]MDQ7761483.1 hypothetical protein [Xanthomonas sontii]UZK09022.1 hypothetical protein CJ027_021225 [Xanthomonas sontii]
MDISFFRENVTGAYLEAEVNPSAVDKFEAAYQQITGMIPVVGEGYQHQPNKWGAECRVYFNCDSDLSDEFSVLEIEVEEGARPYKQEWRFRVNNNEFFWALIRAGYRLEKK